MANHVELLEESLSTLLDVCEQEQQALVSLDSDRLIKLIPRKASVLSQVAGHLKQIGGRMPKHLLPTATRCRRLNAANKKMLVLTVRCLDSLTARLGPKKDSPYGMSSGYRTLSRIDRRA